MSAKTLKDCQLFGNPSADRTDDIYPTVPVCAEHIKSGYVEDGPIMSVGEKCTDPDARCHFCTPVKAE